MEAIIKEMREEMVGKESGDQASDTARAEEHERVMEAVKEGLLQTHASPPTASRLGSSGYCARTPMGSITGLAGTRKLQRHWISRTT